MKSVIRRLIYYYSLDVPRYTFLCSDKGPMHPDVKMRPNGSQPQRLRALLFFKFFNQAIKDAEHDLFSSYPGDRFFLSLYLPCKTRDFWLSCLPLWGAGTAGISFVPSLCWGQTGLCSHKAGTPAETQLPPTLKPFKNSFICAREKGHWLKYLPQKCEALSSDP